jgi:hypothetical protein
MPLRRLSPQPLVMLATLVLSAACAANGGVSRNGSAEPVAPIAFTPPVSAVGIALAHATELGITDTQRGSLEAIRGRLDSMNVPLRTRLDSLRPTLRPINPADLSQEQRDDIRRRRIGAREIMGRYRENDLVVRPQVLAVLTPEQQQKVAVYEGEARRREADADRSSARAPQEGEQRRSGGQGGRASRS